MGKKIKLTIYVGLVLTALLLNVTGLSAQGNRVLVLEIEGPVTPVMVSYISRGIQHAEATGIEAMVIVLDTPGGSVTLMEEIVKAIRSATVPVVVYVAPPGAMAASAGTVVILAAHVAAMAPETSIGAASPVSGEGQELGETVERKEKEILKAQARGLARRRGKEAVAWAEQAIEESKAASADEALELGVVDFIANDLNDLLRQMDGFMVTVMGDDIILHTAGATSEKLPMNALEHLMHTIANPTIAVILMTIGVNALIYELSAPGGYVAGIIGVICLGLGLYALGVLSVDYTGLIFIALAFVLFVLDIKAPTHGVLLAGGIASFVFGAVLLFQSSSFDVPWGTIISMAALTGGFFAFIVAQAIRAQSWRVTTGGEALIGAAAVARTDLTPKGTVFLMGEYWNAVAEEGDTIKAGAPIDVVGREGFSLRVRAKSTDSPKGAEQKESPGRST
jgi:membrane-bound serine protease (ClpP class)